MANANIVVNYQDLIQAIGTQLQDVWAGLKESSDENVRKEIANIKSIEISDEQSYIKKKDQRVLEQGSVYVVIRFGVGSMNFGSTVAPVSLYCIGTANKVKPVQYLLGTFASTWSTKSLLQGLSGQSNNISQVWNTPEVVTNFNQIYSDFRNLYRLAGNIVIGPQSVRLGTITYIFDEDAEEQEEGSGSEIVSFMSFQDGYRSSLDSQPFGNTNGFVQSEVDFSTYTFTVSTYLLNNHLTADVLAIRGFRNFSGSGIQSTFKQNQKMKIRLDFGNGYNNYSAASQTASSDDPVLGDDFYEYFKVVDSAIGQEIAGIPTLTITFTR